MHENDVFKWLLRSLLEFWVSEVGRMDEQLVSKKIGSTLEPAVEAQMFTEAEAKKSGYARVSNKTVNRFQLSQVTVQS